MSAIMQIPVVVSLTLCAWVLSFHHGRNVSFSPTVEARLVCKAPKCFRMSTSGDPYLPRCRIRRCSTAGAATYAKGIEWRPVCAQAGGVLVIAINQWNGADGRRRHLIKTLVNLSAPVLSFPLSLSVSLLYVSWCIVSPKWILHFRPFPRPLPELMCPPWPLLHSFLPLFSSWPAFSPLHLRTSPCSDV